MVAGACSPSGVLVFGVNFNLYYYLMLRRVKAFFGDEELRAYLVIVLVSTGLISLNTLYLYPGFSKSFEMAFFQVSNIITTTGFGYGDITNLAPLLPVLSFSSSWESVVLLVQPQVDSRLFEASSFQNSLKILDRDRGY